MSTIPLAVEPAVRFHLSLNVSNLARSVAFYRVLFDREKDIAVLPILRRTLRLTKRLKKPRRRIAKATKHHPQRRAT